MGTKLGQNIHDHKILFEFDYGCNRIRTTAVICPRIRKIAKFDFVCSLASTIINQSAPNLVKRYRAIRSRVSSILGVIASEQLQLFALEFEKIAIFHFVYTVSSTNINQLNSKLVKIYMILRSHMSLIKGVIGSEQVELFALEL